MSQNDRIRLTPKGEAMLGTPPNPVTVVRHYNPNRPLHVQAVEKITVAL